MGTNQENQFAFGKENYKLFAIAVAVVVVGYLLMVGGGSDDPNQFNGDELFSVRRITIAPILVLSGLGLAVYAIVKKPKEQSN